MDPAERKLGNDRADKSKEHVPLRVPGVALGTQERVSALAQDHGGPPLNQLVQGADSEADTCHQKEEPCAGSEWCAPEKDLAGDHGRNKTLGEMAETVVMVPGKSEEVAYPVPCRDLGVGVMTSDHENDRMQDNQAVQKGREGKTAVRRDKERRRNDDRRHLEHPGEPVVRIDSGEEKEGNGDAEQSNVFAGIRHGRDLIFIVLRQCMPKLDWSQARSIPRGN